jgi:FkbM family methyltransferase
MKIYYKAKFGSNYEISDLLLKVLKDDDIFFDVGANLGQYIIRIKQKFKSGVKIYAFEPFNINYSILSEHILRKYNNVIVENCAVSDVNGQDILYIPLIDDIEIDTQASIDYENRKMYYDEFTKQEIRKITIDNYVEINDVSKIDYLKIDTEGNDERVIKGAIKSISEFKPVIFCEDMESKQTLDKLYELDYSRFLLGKSNKLVGYSGDKPDNVFNDLVIFIPKGSIHIFGEYLVNM